MARKLITIVLLAFALFSLGFLIAKEASHNGNNNAASDNTNDLKGDEKRADRVVTIYYFHATKRCPTCLEIEGHAKEAIEDYYSNELENGLLEWEIINYEDWGNKHFVDDYDLMYSSLILTERVNGTETKWKNLDSIWDLAWEREDFISYVRGKIDQYLYSQDALISKADN
jgi:hypothetical protein